MGAGRNADGGTREVRCRARELSEGSFRNFGDRHGFFSGWEVGELRVDSGRDDVEEPGGWQREAAVDVRARAGGTASVGSGGQADRLCEQPDGTAFAEHGYVTAWRQ